MTRVGDVAISNRGPPLLYKWVIKRKANRLRRFQYGVANLMIAMRVLRKNPLFTLTAVVTIALGLGATTAIFSVTNGVLLQPLPYKDPDRLVIASADLRQRHVRDTPYSNADFIDLKDGTKSAFEDFAGVFSFRNAIPREDGTPEQITMAIATTNFFRLMGGESFSGAIFMTRMEFHSLPRARNRAAGAAAVPRVAILSYEYFGGVLAETRPRWACAGRG